MCNEYYFDKQKEKENYDWIDHETILYKNVRTNTLVAYECIGAINIKCTMFLIGHLLYTQASTHKCHLHLITSALRFYCLCVWCTYGELCVWHRHMYLVRAHVVLGTLVCVCGRHDLCLMHTAGVPEISICQSGFSRWENFTVLTSIKINRHSIEMKGHSSHWRWH